VIRSAILELADGDFAVFTDDRNGVDSRGCAVTVENLRDAILECSYIEFDARVSFGDEPGGESWRQAGTETVAVRRTVFTQFVTGIVVPEEGVDLGELF